MFTSHVHWSRGDKTTSIRSRTLGRISRCNYCIQLITRLGGTVEYSSAIPLIVFRMKWCHDLLRPLSARRWCIFHYCECVPVKSGFGCGLCSYETLFHEQQNNWIHLQSSTWLPGRVHRNSDFLMEQNVKDPLTMWINLYFRFLLRLRPDRVKSVPLPWRTSITCFYTPQSLVLLLWFILEISTLGIEYFDIHQRGNSLWPNKNEQMASKWISADCSEKKKKTLHGLFCSLTLLLPPLLAAILHLHVKHV